MLQAVLFDLDGTLADTAMDLGGALNRLLAKKGLPIMPMSAMRPIASHGANGLIKLGAGIDLDHPDHARWRREYLAEYEQVFCCDTVLFADINDLIDGLHRQGLTWGIITNKPHTFTHRLVPKLGFASAPAVVVSGDTCSRAKPATEPMFYACEQIGVAAGQCVYVGDAERDMQAGRNAGMKTVLADWGYIAADDRTEAWPFDLRIRQPLDLLACL